MNIHHNNHEQLRTPNFSQTLPNSYLLSKTKARDSPRLNPSSILHQLDACTKRIDVRTARAPRMRSTPHARTRPYTRVSPVRSRTASRSMPNFGPRAPAAPSAALQYAISISSKCAAAQTNSDRNNCPASYAALR